jgi:hypothetical protein
MVRCIVLVVLFLIFLITYRVVGKQTEVKTANNPVSGLKLTMQKNLITRLTGDAGPLALGILLGGNDGLLYEASHQENSDQVM